TRGARMPAAGAAAGAERVAIGIDHDMTGGSRDEAPTVVDDRAARAEQIDGAVGLLVRLGGVLLPVQHLERPGGQQQQRDPERDDESEDGPADVEAGAAEVRRVRAGVRLEAGAGGHRRPGYRAIRPRSRPRGVQARTSATRAPARRAGLL